MRLLMIDDDPRFRSLVHQHVRGDWANAEVVAHDPNVQGVLAPEFLAQGFDAVLLDHDCPERGDGLEWLADLAGRKGFAPIVFLSEQAGDSTAQRALELGASAVLSKNALDRKALLAAVKRASERQTRARVTWRASPEGKDLQRFSDARLPGYRRIGRLASGPVSDLYLAESERAGALVVIKVTRDRKHGNELDQSFKRFLQEYEVVQRIHHPGVVRLYDLGITDEHAYLVMEYFRAGDLRQHMRGGVTVRQSLQYAIEIAHALDATHRAGILHRDLKPGNVMLRDDGSLALIDFGLAKQEALDLEITGSGMIFGTPHYMSPEQGHGEPIDERSDLYSLGVMLFEMLTRHKPFAAENPMAIIYLHRKSPIPRLPAGLAVLQPVIDRLLAKQPVERFESAAAVVTALEQSLNELAGAERVA
jgi:eukaryotic-like serine/threonine-protein kinase